MGSALNLTPIGRTQTRGASDDGLRSLSPRPEITQVERRPVMRLFVAKTAAKRAAGSRPSRTQAFVAASATAGMLGVLAYKLLRSGE
jgi:hypothetical protein